GGALHLACGGAGVLAMLWLALSAAERGAVAPALAAALVFLMLALLEVWAGAGLAWQALQSGRVAARRLEAIVEHPAGVADPAHPLVPPARGELRFEQVVFAWPDGGRPLLRGLDLRVAPGERIVIGGDSGCGKTTLSALLLRLWDPLEGQVSYAGIDLRAMAQADWHRRVAWLPQNAPVFAGSLRENLAIGDPRAGEAAMWRVLEQVRLREWARCQGGLDAWVGENGTTMSAGQARRLALARALLRDAPVLLLDEPTEGLDVDTAHALLRDLAQALGERTLVMISHDELPEGVVHRRYRMQDGRLRTLG
ncbi:MAG: ATP-binding cassette domain-containing protein, partial [Pseudomonas sp.]